MPESAQRFCAECGSELPEQALLCPQCQKLVFSEELEALAARAKALEQNKDWKQAMVCWNEALELLPPEAAQARTIREHLVKLEEQSKHNGWKKTLGPLAAVALLAWKLKGVLLVVLGKAKFLVMGLGKVKTLFSMLAYLGVYWAMYGWKFAAGFVVGIYIHEMGHVWAMRRYGLRAGAPMFIPGVGAFVSLYDSPADEKQDARIGLEGPLWGLGASLFAFGAAQLTGQPVWLAIAHANAFVNLFNLIPVWQLDGGRGFRSLTQVERIAMAVLFAGLWFVTGEGLFFLLIAGAAYRIFVARDPAPATDHGVVMRFAALAVILGILCMVPARHFEEHTQRKAARQSALVKRS